jgi:hypothetical protein
LGSYGNTNFQPTNNIPFETPPSTDALQEKLFGPSAAITRPSLSRQIRDLGDELGTPPFTRGAKGVQSTPAGRVFLDHARVMLSQAEAAVQSARQIAYPTVPSLSLLIGLDTPWLLQSYFHCGQN